MIALNNVPARRIMRTLLICGLGVVLSNSGFAVSAESSVDNLYREHQPWLRQWLRRKVGCAETAADLAQDTFLRIITKPYFFESALNARAFLSKVANGLCIDLWRRQQIEQAWLETLACRPQLEVPSPEVQLLMIEALCRVDAMLCNLPEKVATAFLLAQVEGLTYREIALQLGVSERMIKKYMAQAMLHCALIDADYLN